MCGQYILRDLITLLSVTYLTLTHAAPTFSDVSSEDSITSSLPSSHAVVAALVCLVVMVLVLVLLVPGCMDCMNSEVSSESHPACGDTPHKWGGAAGYSRANENDPSSGYRSGESVNPNSNLNQPLPYSLIPTQVPEDAGFRGYQSGGDGNGQSYGTGGGLAGYNSGVGSRGGGEGRPTHYNPMEPEEPPPAYGEATAQY